MIRVLVLLALAPLAACSGDEEPDTLACVDAYAPGATVPAEDEPCLDRNGEPVLLMAAIFDCDSGEQVFANEYGTWRASDRVAVAPVDPADPTAEAIDAACAYE